MTIYVNGNIIEASNFSGGECHVCLPGGSIGDESFVTAYLHSSDAIMQLLMTINALRHSNAESAIYLTIPYFPYARQDRVCNSGEAFSLEVMTSLINGLECDSVTVIDPHSAATTQRLENCTTLSITDVLSQTQVVSLIQEHNFLVVSPDKGARQKVTDFANHIGAESICADKIRNPKTREIVSTAIHDDVRGRDCIIVDDICDGGRTFVELAKVLKNKGAKNLYLYVTHGIFSHGTTQLKKYYDTIFCYHTVNAPLGIEHDVNIIDAQ